MAIAWYTADPQRPVGFRPREISALVNGVVLDQHSEDAAFLWGLRDRAVRAPHYSLKDLAALDERVEAHLDGLRMGHRFGWERCQGKMAKPEAGDIFAAAVLALDGVDEDRFHVVVNAALADPELQRGLISGVGWLPFSRVAGRVNKLLGSANPDLQSLGLAGYAVHRQDPGRALVEGLNSLHPRLRARALRTCGILGAQQFEDNVSSLISDKEDPCRFFAAWSAVRLGNRQPAVLGTLREIADGRTNFAPRAMEIALRTMGLQAARSWYEQIKANPARQRSAAIAAGIIGNPEVVPDLIAYMALPALARVAGEAFSMITGVDLAYQDMSGDPPEGFEAGPNENLDDDDVEMDPDENLPWPIPALAAEWWMKNGERFLTGVRYFLGNELAPGSLRDALITGKQRQRAAAALELGLREPGRPLFPVHSRGVLQMQALGLWNW